MKSVPYEALDNTGTPFTRPARIISELPWRQRKGALISAMDAVSQQVGIEAIDRISFGIPVFNAFGLNANEARKHPKAALLMTAGCDISLELVPGFMTTNAISGTNA